MFGTLRPHGCVLSPTRREDYRHAMCGLCAGLGQHYGLLSRALTSHDAVFLALLADGLREAASAETRCRCPMLPVVRRACLHPEAVPVRYAAAVQMLLADQWLADRAAEGKWLARWARPLAARRVARARVLLAELGIDATPLLGFERLQASCEAEPTIGPERAATPTAEALGYLLGTLEPSASPAEARPGPSTLARLGHGLGMVIYLVDALDDLAEDERSGDFNPCLAATDTGGRRPERRADPARVEHAIALLRRELETVQSAFVALPLYRHRELLASILQDQLVRHARRAIAKARAWVDNRRRLATAPWLWVWGVVLRMLQPVALVLSVAASWLLGGRVAFAEGGPKRPSLPPAQADGGPPDAGPDAGSPDAGPGGPFSPGGREGGSTSPPSGAGDGGPPASSGAPSPTGTPGAGPGSPSPDPGATGHGPGSGSGSGGSPPSSPCPRCGLCDSCCDCNGWFDKCCGSTCIEPCKGCCNDPCKSCCSSCGDPCKGCCGGSCCCK